jgi:hypothetical protein
MIKKIIMGIQDLFIFVVVIVVGIIAIMSFNK